MVRIYSSVPDIWFDERDQQLTKVVAALKPELDSLRRHEQLLDWRRWHWTVAISMAAGEGLAFVTIGGVSAFTIALLAFLYALGRVSVWATESAVRRHIKLARFERCAGAYMLSTGVAWQVLDAALQVYDTNMLAIIGRHNPMINVLLANYANELAKNIRPGLPEVTTLGLLRGAASRTAADIMSVVKLAN